jgi:hypothetical protein
MSSIILDENQAIFWDGSRATIFTIDFNLSKTEKEVKLFLDGSRATIFTVKFSS